MKRTLRENVLVSPVLREDKTNNFGLLTQVASDDINLADEGIVICMSDKLKKEGEIKLGDKIAFGKFAGLKVDHNGSMYFLISKKEIIFKNVEEQVVITYSPEMDFLTDLGEREYLKTVDKSYNI